MPKKSCTKSSSKKRDVQPIFYYDGKTDNEIKAGGVMFYTYDKKSRDLKFLMIKNRNRYEDFGGKTDSEDSSIEETIAREVEEESNGIFKKTDILDRIKDKKPIYTKNSKYLIYFCKLKKNENYNTDIFGDREFYEDIPRTVEWITYGTLKNSSFIKDNLNFRLKFKHFFDKMNKLNSKYIRKPSSVSAPATC